VILGHNEAVTDLTDRVRRLQDVDAWFGGHGFGLVVVDEDGEWWALLFSKQSLQIGAPRYGRGGTPEEAAESARSRFKEEQAVE